MPELTNRQLSEAVLSMRKEIAVLSGKVAALEAAVSRHRAEKDADDGTLSLLIERVSDRVGKLEAASGHQGR